MAPFDRPYTTFYWSAIVSIALSCVISEIKRGICQKIAIYFIHLVLSRLRYGGLCRNIAIPFDTEKLEWCG